MSYTILGKFDNALIEYIRPYIEVSWEQDIAQNNSIVTATLYFHRYTGNYWSYNELTNNNGHSCTFRIGNSSLTQIRPFNLQRDNYPNRVPIWTRTVTVKHNTNGTASIYIGANGSTKVNPDTYDFGETIALPTIPRQTEINSVSIANQLRPSVSNTLTVSLDRKHSSYTHRFEIMDGTTELQSSTGNLVTSINITSTTVNKMIDLMKTVKSREFTLRVVTLNSGTVVGRNTANFTVTLNDAYTSPTITGDYHAILGSGHDSTIDKYVQNISRMRVVFGANYGRGAEHQSMSVRVDGQPANGIIIPDGRYRADTQTLSKSGSVEIVMTATNSRGQSTSKTLTATVHAYGPPRITSFTAERSEINQTNVLVTRRHSFSTLGGDNVITANVQRSLSTSTIFSTENNSNSSNLSATITGNIASNSYIFKTTITDSFGNSSTAQVSVGTARVLQEKYKDLGISVGQRFDPNNPAIFQVGGDISLVDEKGFTTNLLNHNFQKANLQNGWTHSSTNLYGEVGYYKIGGIVYLTGLVGGGTDMANHMFILPEGFRPPVMYRFLVATPAGEYEQLNILAGGAVNKASSRNSYINWVSLAGVSFPVGG